MSPPPGWSCAVTTNGLDVVSHKRAQGPYLRAVHVLGRCPMDNRVAGCQPPARATPLLRFGLHSPPGVVGMVMAPGSASGKHPFYVVCKCGLGCCVCGGRRVGIGAWGRAPPSGGGAPRRGRWKPFPDSAHLHPPIGAPLAPLAPSGPRMPATAGGHFLPTPMRIVAPVATLARRPVPLHST